MPYQRSPTTSEAEIKPGVVKPAAVNSAGVTSSVPAGRHIQYPLHWGIGIKFFSSAIAPGKVSVASIESEALTALYRSGVPFKDDAINAFLPCTPKPP